MKGSAPSEDYGFSNTKAPERLRKSPLMDVVLEIIAKQNQSKGDNIGASLVSGTVRLASECTSPGGTIEPTSKKLTIDESIHFLSNDDCKI